MLIRPPCRTYVDWSLDSTRWDSYRPRRGDIIIATAPKCGTTWMQRIVALLVFNDPAPRSIDEVSPWLDMRTFPIEGVIAAIEAQAHRRFLKAHLPLDGLPLHNDVRYIHVARDGRDVAMSLHNHATGYSAAARARRDQTAAGDARLKYPHPEISDDPREFFRMWLTTTVHEGQTDGAPHISFFDTETSFWSERRRDNVLLVHYADLKADLDGEMRRIARFLDLDPATLRWPDLVEAASFAAMKSEGAKLKPISEVAFDGGAKRFFNKGTNGRWKDLFTEDDLRLYDAKVREKFSPSLAAWIEGGRRLAGDPATAPD
jgi:aryl sulfotransferase